MAVPILNHPCNMSAVWGRAIKKILTRLFWLAAAVFFGGVILGQTREGTWQVAIVPSPMGDKSFATASLDATETFHGARPRFVIACEVADNPAIHGTIKHGPTNVYIDLGAKLPITEKEVGNHVFEIGIKFDADSRTVERFRQSGRVLFHEAADQKGFVHKLAESHQLIVDLSSTLNNTQIIAFTTTGLKPYVPQLAQACGWGK